MKFDIFFSISQTPAHGVLPSEAAMFRNFFDQVIAADELGFGVGWVAESHLSSEVQKSHKKPVIPHWQGEVGLNADIFQLAHQVFAKTRRIELGSAVMNLLTNGGPVAHAERAAIFASLHGLHSNESRRLHLGFATGRFDFMAAAFGIHPRSPFEEMFWHAIKGRILREATEIFLRLLRGEALASDDISAPFLPKSALRSDEEWARATALSPAQGDQIPLQRRFTFDRLKIIPQDWRRELIQPVIGTHDPDIQEFANQFLPVQVFNLSITQPAVIEDTHRRMEARYHALGGPWRREFMPRTVFVFLNEQAHLSPEQRRSAAQTEAREALGAYWTALEGTIDPHKVSNAANNALIGDAEQIAAQIRERFHPDDRLMLWFDFFNHDSARVIENMAAFMEKVRPLL